MGAWSNGLSLKEAIPDLSTDVSYSVGRVRQKYRRIPA